MLSFFNNEFHNASNKLNIPLDMLKDLNNAVNDGRLENVGLSIPANMTKKQAENALDFYIAFYMGRVMPHESINGHCVILSKDHDYDPLILHVQKEFDASRCERIESYEVLAKHLGVDLKKEAQEKFSQSRKEKKPAKTTTKQKNPSLPIFDVNKAVIKAKKLLKDMAQNPPTTRAKLQNALKSWFKVDKITESNLQKLIDGLQKAGVLTLTANGTKVEYGK